MVGNNLGKTKTIQKVNGEFGLRLDAPNASELAWTTEKSCSR
jgi:hypothetical protein